MDNIEKNKIKGRQREVKSKIGFADKAINDLKVSSVIDKGQYIIVRFKDQRSIWYYLSELLKKKKKRDFTCFYV